MDDRKRAAGVAIALPVVHRSTTPLALTEGPGGTLDDVTERITGQQNAAGEDGPRRPDGRQKDGDGGSEDGPQPREHGDAEKNRESRKGTTLGGYRPAGARHRREATLIVRFTVCHARPTHYRSE